MTVKLKNHLVPLVLAMSLAACATSPGDGSIYVPAGGGDKPRAPEPPRVGSEPVEPSVHRKSKQLVIEPRSPEKQVPRYQERGDELPVAATGLIQKAESLLAAGDAQAAIGQLERAQRIAPRSSQVYFKLAEAYVALNGLGSAEQFTLKGLSLAGSDSSLQRAGWLLLADIRRARGNVAGADQAEARASSL